MNLTVDSTRLGDLLCHNFQLTIDIRGDVADTFLETLKALELGIVRGESRHKGGRYHGHREQS